MMKVIILTGSELRHTFFRKYIALSDSIEVITSYCEGLEKSIQALVAGQGDNTLRTRHLKMREQSEKDFFGLFADCVTDASKPVFLPKGEINSPPHTEAILQSAPDLLIAYGCSIIKEPLLSSFDGRFLNVHLGLSPYYRGSGTNYWPLVNTEPEYVGATFMYIDAGIDTGEIIHQIRARVSPGDSPSQIGNRLIADMARVYRVLIDYFDALKRMPSLPLVDAGRVYRNKDFSEESVSSLYANFAGDLVEKYLAEERARCDRVPLIRNPVIEAAMRLS